MYAGYAGIPWLIGAIISDQKEHITSDQKEVEADFLNGVRAQAGLFGICNIRCGNIKDAIRVYIWYFGSEIILLLVA